MSANPDSPAETQEDSKANKVSQWGKQLLSATGWLILLTAVVLALRPTALSAKPNVENVSSSSTTTNHPNPHSGRLHAPVTIVEFGDQLSIVWADFPSVTPASPDAAEAA